jgi:hypothetical protein
MTTRRKKKSQDGFLKKVSSLFNLDTVSHTIESNFRVRTTPVPRLSSGNATSMRRIEAVSRRRD